MNEIVSPWVMPGIEVKRNGLLDQINSRIAYHGGRNRVIDILECEMVKVNIKHNGKVIPTEKIGTCWKQYEIDFLMKNKSTMTSKQISTELGRSIYAVHWMKSKIRRGTYTRLPVRAF